MREMLLHSTKFPGTLHYKYPVAEIHRSDQLLVTHCRRGAPVESYRGSWLATRNILSFFQAGKPYVFHVHWENGWTPVTLYVDIADNVHWQDDIVRYVDLDLDVMQQYGSSEVLLDDEDEFDNHRVTWAYPDALIAQCWSAVEEVRGLLIAPKEPLTQSLFAWRPGAKLDLAKLHERAQR